MTWKASDRHRVLLLGSLLLLCSGVSVAQEESAQTKQDDSTTELRREASQLERNTEDRILDARKPGDEQIGTAAGRESKENRETGESQATPENREPPEREQPANITRPDKVEEREAEQREVEQRPEPVTEPERQPSPIEAEEKAERITEPDPEREPETKPKPDADAELETETETQESDTADKETSVEDQPEAVEPKPTRPPIQRGGSLLGPAAPPPVPVPPPPQLAPVNSNSDPISDPDTQSYEPGELLLISADMADAQSAARQLQSYQLRVKSRERLENLGLVISVFRLPPDTNVPSLVARLRSELPNLNLDTNQRYQPLNARRQYGQRLIKWPQAPGACISDFRVGMLDTAVSDQHPALVDTALVRRNFARGEPAASVHGTAVASLLIGQPGSLVPGILPGSQLFAAEVFRQRGESSNAITDTTTETLLAALDWLASQRVQAINLSLGGEHNRVFELALAQLLERRIRLIAAAGNQGPDAPPVFPAAQPGILAVTAVDATEQLYPLANRGDYIDLAAPGVDIWAADGETEGRYHSGTSFAAPFATAALLLSDQQGIALMENAKDLGPDGRDDDFGWGLVQVTDGCR